MKRHVLQYEGPPLYIDVTCSYDKEHGFSGVSLFRFRLRADLLIGISD